MDQPVLMFFYGSLRRGFFNYDRFLKTYEHKWLGVGQTVEKFSLKVPPGHWLPKVSKDPATQIFGDLVEVGPETLKVLDRVERHPDWYCREEVEVEMDGKRYKAWLYFTVQPDTEGVLVESGDYYTVKNAHEILNTYGRKHIRSHRQSGAKRKPRSPRLNRSAAKV